MKWILFLWLGIFITLYSCDKKDEVKPELKLENLYAIQDDASDSIRHKVYEIYRNYGVSVFFNDTVGKVFVRTDVKGDSVFHYELLDPAWTFTGYNSLEYNYTYMTDPDEQSKFLSMLEEFLKKCSKTLYPYSVLVVNNYKTTNSKDEITLYSEGSYKVFYKLLLITGSNMTELDGKPDEMIRTIIEERITDYKDLLSAFQRVSKNFRGPKDWATLGIKKLTIPFQFDKIDSWGNPTVIVVEDFINYPLYGGTTCLDDSWWGFRDFTVEAVELCRKSVRAEIGKFGFVGQSLKSYGVSAPPKDEEDDLKVFVKEVMRYPKKDFEAIWGDYPLVMQKYEILSGIIIDELGVEL